MLLVIVILLWGAGKWKLADDNSGRATTEERRYREKGFANNNGLDA